MSEQTDLFNKPVDLSKYGVGLRRVVVEPHCVSVQAEFYNTTHLAGMDLALAKDAARRQADAVLYIFATKPGAMFSPSQVWKKGETAGLSWLLTSVRRTMSDLTKTGKLRRTSLQVLGPYGRVEYLWKGVDDAHVG
jgi:hypothetical protein